MVIYWVRLLPLLDGITYDLSNKMMMAQKRSKVNYLMTQMQNWKRKNKIRIMRNSVRNKTIL